MMARCPTCDELAHVRQAGEEVCVAQATGRQFNRPRYVMQDHHHNGKRCDGSGKVRT